VNAKYNQHPDQKTQYEEGKGAAQTTYAQVSKCKNDKINEREKKERKKHNMIHK
jgi:hypothetical protein